MAVEEATFAVDSRYEQRLNADPKLTHIICQSGRPCGRMFFRTLELRHFRPCTRDNDRLHLMHVVWQGLAWFVASMPLEFRAIADQVAHECGMRVADGVPHVVGAGVVGVAVFPINSSTAFTLENKKGSMVYDGPQAREQLEKIEVDKIREEERRHYAWFDAQNEMWYRGRLWKRLIASAMNNDQLAKVVEVREFGGQRGKPALWFTESECDRSWTPYPR